MVSEIRFSVRPLQHLGHIYTKGATVCLELNLERRPLLYLVNSGVTRVPRLGHCKGNVLRGKTISFPSWPQEGGAQSRGPPAAYCPSEMPGPCCCVPTPLYLINT